MTSGRSPARRIGTGVAGLLVVVGASCTGAADDTATTSPTAQVGQSSPVEGSESPPASSPSDSSPSGPLPSGTFPLPTPTSGPAEDVTPGGPETSPTVPATPGTTGTSAPEPTTSASVPERSVRISSPGGGETVTNPVTLTVEVSGFELVELTGRMNEHEGHLYAFVDETPPRTRNLLPESESIVKSAEPTIELGDLQPGEHTVTVIATHAYPVPFHPRVTDSVTFIVDG